MNENSELFLEQIRNTEFLSKGEVNLDAISKASVSDILEFIEQMAAFTNVKNIQPERLPFAHTASIGMAGGRYPCSGLQCRLERVEELCQFSALYSEKIYVKNVLSDHLYFQQEYVQQDEGGFKARFAEDLTCFCRMMPLMEAGLIVSITPPNSCVHELLGDRLGEENFRKLDVAIESLRQVFREGISGSIEKIGNFWRLEVKAEEELLEHKELVFQYSGEVPEFLEKHPRLLARFSKGEKIALSRKTLRELGIAEELSGEVIRSLAFELTFSKLLNTGYLTNRDLDVSFLQSVSSTPGQNNSDADLAKNLTALIPFIGLMDPVDLLRIREQERDSFILFRQALRKAMGEYSVGKDRLSEKEVQDIHGDIIAPELARISKKLEEARRALLRHVGSRVTGWTAALSIGTFLGIVPGSAAQIAVAFGLTKVLADLFEKIGTAFDPCSVIRNEDYYFLWKVKRRSAI